MTTSKKKTKKKTSKQGVIRDSKGKFVKGFSGNPTGRPINTLAKTAKELLQEVQKSGRTRQDLFVRQTINDAFNHPDVAVRNLNRKLIWNYVDGMPPQKTELTSPLDVKVTHELSPEQQKILAEGVTKLLLDVHGKPKGKVS